MSGMKTHVVVIGGILTIIGMFVSGDLAAADAVTRAMELLGISMLRIGVAKVPQ